MPHTVLQFNQPTQRHFDYESQPIGAATPEPVKTVYRARGARGWVNWLALLISIVALVLTGYAVSQIDTSRGHKLNDIKVWVEDHKARDLARRVCDPYYDALKLVNLDFASAISFFFNTELTPEEHLEVCTSIFMPPSPPPMVIMSTDAPAVRALVEPVSPFCADVLRMLSPEQLAVCRHLSNEPYASRVCACAQ